MNKNISNAVGIDNFDIMACNANSWHIAANNGENHYMLNLSYGGTSIAYSAQQLNGVQPGLPLMIDHAVLEQLNGQVPAHYIFAGLQILKNRYIRTSLDKKSEAFLVSLRSISFDSVDMNAVYISADHVFFETKEDAGIKLPIVSALEAHTWIASHKDLDNNYPNWRNRLSMLCDLGLDIEKDIHIIFPNEITHTASVTLPSFE